jgi:hypothetical protein
MGHRQGRGTQEDPFFFATVQRKDATPRRSSSQMYRALLIPGILSLTYYTFVSSLCRDIVR